LIIIAEAIREMVLIKSLLIYINNHSLIKIIYQEYSIEEHDPVTTLWTIVKDYFHLITKKKLEQQRRPSNAREISQITMLLILKMLNVSTQGFDVRTGKLWTQIQVTFKQKDTSEMEHEAREVGSI